MHQQLEVRDTAMEIDSNKTSSGRPSAVEALALSTVAVLAFVSVPQWISTFILEAVPSSAQQAIDKNWLSLGMLLAFSLLLVAGSWKRSGIRIGNIRRHWWKVLIVCGVPTVLTVVGYLFLTDRPMSGIPLQNRIVGPFCEDLVFMGFIYGLLDMAMPGRIHPRIPVNKALALGACYFSLGHLSGLGGWPAYFVLLQCLGASAFYVLGGLSRQWTGSLLYVALAHAASHFAIWVIG